ncbi:MAG: hypothetical protein JWN86_4425 [Planctomycetota bacterium]|nr:hypothetical protein [Planctomycetota bacterium]
MVHFTCDLCGKDLAPCGEPRFVVKIAAYAGYDPNQITEDDLDEDHMEAVAQILRREEAEGALSSDLDAPAFKGFRYDLCSDCHGRFIKDPLNRDTMKILNFSEN